MGKLLRRLGHLFRQARFDVELDEELEFHREMKRRELEVKGIRASGAVDRELGNLTLARDESRDVWIWPWLQSLAQDVKFALRLFRRDRGFALTAVLVLAAGIGMTNAVFTMMNALLSGGLSDADEQIMFLGTQNEHGRFSGLSKLDFDDWREGSRSFTGIAAHFTLSNMNVTDDTYVPESVAGTYLSIGAFRLLDVQPILGREFLPEDERRPATAATTVIISYRLWQRRYSGDPTALGRRIKADNREATIIGVMPDGFSFPGTTQFWLPMPVDLFDSAFGASARNARTYAAFGRLADGVTMEHARAELELVAERAAAAYPATNRGVRPRVERLSELTSRGARAYLVRLLAAVLFVLLIACANVASLLLARSAYRAREMAFRLSLGATRWRLIRQLLVESLLLALVAGIVGLGVSAVALQFFEANVFKPYWAEWRMDARVVFFLVAMCLGTGLLFGLAPALQVSKADLNVLLKEGSRLGGGGTSARRWTMGLLVAEFALTLTLLSGVGLMLRSFLFLYRESQVIDPSGLVTMQVRIGGQKYFPQLPRRAFYTGIQDALAAAPEVESFTLVSELPLLGGGSRSLLIEGRPNPSGPPPSVTYITVGARYFETLKLPLLRGRLFTPLDGTPGNQSAIVNQRFVDMFFPDEDPLGRGIHLNLANPSNIVAPPPPLTIVGVSPTVRQGSIGEQPEPVVYVPFQVDAGVWARLILRPRTDVETLVRAVRREVAKVDAEAPVSEVMLLEDAIADSSSAGAFHRRLMRLLGMFAGIAVVLAAVGIYAVTAYTVAQRTQEIGLRMALGARASQVVGLFVGQAMRPLVLGVLFGLGGAFVAGRLLRNWLVKPAPVDPATLLMVAVLLVLIGLAAAFYPSWRGARVDPSTALRTD